VFLRKIKYVTRDLLTLLISLFILNACKNPAGVGLDNNPGDSFYGVLNDTVTLRTSTVKDDSARSVLRVQSQNTNIPAITISQLPFGYFKDEVLGETQADVAFTIVRPDEGDARLPEDAQIDSAVLVLRYGTSFVGDSVSSVFPVQVQQLNEAYNPVAAYYTTKSWETKADILASAQIHKFHLNDSVAVVIKGSTGEDSTIKTSPQMRLKLNNSFVSTLFSHENDSTTFNSDAGFNEKVKGFYLTVDKANLQGVGGLATMGFIDGINTSGTPISPNGITVTYRTKTDDGERDTTLTKTYPISLPSTSQTNSYMSASIKRSFSTDVQMQLANSTANHTTVYAQAMGGLKTRISFPYINQLQGKKIAVNRAELVVYVDEEHLGETAPAPRLTLYRKDIAGNNQPTPDGDSRYSRDPRSQYGLSAPGGGIIGPYALGGFYNKTQKRYVFILTSFIQDVLLGKVQNTDLYLAPVLENVNVNGVPFWPDINTPTRVVLKGFNPADAEAKKEMRTKLNIYYTQLD